MKKYLVKAIKAAAGLVCISLGLAIFFYFPSEETVYLVGTEVKRENTFYFKLGETKDVRYVVAREPSSGDTLMFRNEDIVFPPYFKFDSGDVAGKVMNYEEFHPDKKFRLTYYGLRIPILSIYPNLTKISFTDSHSSLVEMRIAYLISVGVLIGLIIWLMLKIKSALYSVGSKVGSVSIGGGVYDK